MDKNITGNQTIDGSFLNVLLALKENIMIDLNVADVGIITKIKDNYNIYCNLLTNSSAVVVCSKLKNLELSENDCVLILYTNEDFRANLKRLKNNQSIVNIDSNIYHNKTYGIIVGIL